jgi:hypothetical protein
MSNGIAPLATPLGTEPALPAGAGGGVKPSGTTYTPAETTTTQAQMHPNPSFHIDAALGLVVMEFRDGAGNVASTIPTTQQLDAYRRSGNHGAQPAQSATTPDATPTAPPAGSGATAPVSAAPAQTARLVSTAVRPASAR